MYTLTLPVFLSILLAVAFGHKEKPTGAQLVAPLSPTRRDAAHDYGPLLGSKPWSGEFLTRYVFTDEIQEILDMVHAACVDKTGASEEDIANCENGIFKEDPKLKCYMFCLMEEASLVDEEDNVDYETLVSLIPDEYIERTSNMILSCKYQDTPDKDKCQRAFDVHKCSYDRDPALYFLF